MGGAITSLPPVHLTRDSAHTKQTGRRENGGGVRGCPAGPTRSTILKFQAAASAADPTGVFR
jgi:hypothetical protein